MSNTAEELQNIEISIEEARKAIERKDRLVRLQNNPDYKELIEKGFLEKHAIRQVMLKASPHRQSEKDQLEHDRQITAIGEFYHYTLAIYQQGMMAAQALQEDEATREELLREGIA